MSELSADIEFVAFEAIDLRCGTVTSAERIPKSDKLLKLEVSFGPEIGSRTIVATIAKSYMPESVTGMKVMAVINLAPRKIMGIESRGMLLAANSITGGAVLLATCAGPDGERVR